MRPPKPIRRKTKLSETLQKSVQKGDWDSAILTLDKLCRLEPANPTFPLRRGDYYLKKGWKEEAVQSYAEAARVFTDSGFLIKALAAYKVILRQDPDHSEAKEQILALHARSQASAAAPQPPQAAPEPVPIEGSPVLREPTWVDDGRSLVETDPEILDEGFIGVQPVDYDALLSSPGHFADGESVQVSSSPEEFEIERHWESAEPRGETGGPRSATDAVPLFANMSRDEFHEFTRYMIPLNYPAGGVIVKEGDAGDSVYIISHGSVKIVTRLDQKEVQLGVLKENDFFGEVAFLTGRPRTASVIAAEPTEVLELSGEDLRKIVERFPAVKDVLGDFHQARVRATIDTVKSERVFV